MKGVLNQIFLFICLGLNTIHAQDYQYLNKSDGLPSNTVYHIVQSSDYYLWMTTEMGLARYDGSDIVVYDRSDGLYCNDNFELIARKEQGVIALGGNGSFSEVNNISQEVKSKFEKLKFKSFISELLETKNGKLIASSFGDGIKILEKGKVKHYTKDNGLLDDYVSYIWENNNAVYVLSKDGVSKITEEDQIEVLEVFQTDIHFSRAVKNKDGDIVFTGRNDVYIFSVDERLSKIENSEVITSKTPTKIQIADNGYVVSTYNGVYFFTIEDGKIVVKNSYLLDEEVTSFCKDHEGNYWFSTLNSGVIRLDNLNIELLSTNERVNCLSQTMDGELVFGMNNLGYGIWNGNTSTYNKLEAKNRYSTQKINDIKQFEGRTWFEVDGGVASLQSGNINYYRTGRGIIVQYAGAIYVGNKLGCFKINSLKDLEILREDGVNESLINEKFKKVIDEAVHCLKIFNDQLYIGTERGLFVLKGEYVKRVFDWDDQDAILDVYAKGKELIVCIEEKGLVYSVGDKEYRLTRSNGLSSDFCYKIKIHKEHLFVATSDGLNIIDKSSLFSDRLKNNVNFKGKTVFDVLVTDNYLYVATNSGLYLVNDYNADRTKYSIPLQPFSVLVNNSSRTISEIQNLSYFENNLSFDFNYISFDKSKAIKYYKLNGGEWNEFEGQLQFNEMTPGQYTLELKVEAAGNESAVKKYYFTIHVPWWSTWWFRISAIAFFGLLFYWFFKVRILTYNRDIVRELMQLLLTKLKKEKYILVKNIKDGSKTKIVLNQFLYAESSKNYVTIYLVHDKVIVRSTMKEVHKQLSELSSDYFRCHRSFLINTKKIDAVHSDFFKIGENKIPIGTNYLATAKEKMDILKKGGN